MLRRHFWFILVVVVAALAATYGLTKQQVEVYESSSRVLLRTSGTESLFPNERTAPSEVYRNPSTEARFVQSAEFREIVQPDTPAGTSVQVREGTDELIFTGRGTEPEAVAAAANLWAETYVVEQQASYEASIEADIAFLSESLGVAEDERAELRSEIDTLEDLLEETEDPDQYARLLAQKVSIEATLQPQLAPVERNVSSFRGQISELESLKRFFGDGSISARVTRTAGEPSNPVSPNLMRNLILGGALGLALGIATPYLRELLRNRVMDRSEMIETTELPVLASIPTFKTSSETSIEVLDQPSSVASVNYQALMTSIEFASIEQPIAKMVVTSVAPGDGKTTTSLNLSALAAQHGNVLMVDADMRRPNVHQRLGIPNDKGLAEVLAGEVDLSDVRHTVERDGVRFDVITAGSASQDPASLLRREGWQSVIKDLFLYDFVVVDCPPVLAVTDAVLLGASVDAQIIVTRSGITDRTELAQAVDLLRTNGTRLLGMVLNRENEKTLQYSYYGTYQKARK